MQFRPRIQAAIDAIVEVLQEITTNGNVKTQNLERTRTLLSKRKTDDATDAAREDPST